MNKKQKQNEKEAAFFLAANLMYGQPECGGNLEIIRENFRRFPEHVLRMKNVKQWLRRSARGQEFIRLASRHGFVDYKMAMDNLYRRYANWYFRQESMINGSTTEQEARTDRQGTGEVSAS